MIGRSRIDSAGSAQLPRRRSVPDDAARAGVLHDPEDRRAGERHRSARSPRSSGSPAGPAEQPTSATCRRTRSSHARAARPPAARRRRRPATPTIALLDNDHRLFSGERRDADRHALREDRPLRLDARGHRRRPREPAQHQLRDDVRTTPISTALGNTAQGGTWNNPTAIYHAAVRALELHGRASRLAR